MSLSLTDKSTKTYLSLRASPKAHISISVRRCFLIPTVLQKFLIFAFLSNCSRLHLVLGHTDHAYMLQDQAALTKALTQTLVLNNP